VVFFGQQSVPRRHNVIRGVFAEARGLGLLQEGPPPDRVHQAGNLAQRRALRGRLQFFCHALLAFPLGADLARNKPAYNIGFSGGCKLVTIFIFIVLKKLQAMNFTDGLQYFSSPFSMTEVNCYKWDVDD